MHKVLWEFRNWSCQGRFYGMTPKGSSIVIGKDRTGRWEGTGIPDEEGHEQQPEGRQCVGKW